MSLVTVTVKKLIFSAAASLLFLFFVVPLLGRMNAVESVEGTSTVIVVALFSLSAAGLIAEACIWFANNKLAIIKGTTTKQTTGDRYAISSVASGSPSASESQQPTPAPVENVTATQPARTETPTETPVATTAEISTEEIVARLEAIETRLKEMNNRPEQQQQTAAPAVVVTPPTSKVSSKVAVSSPAQQQQQQQKKNQNHVDALLGGAS
jgi:hypothetical protein